MAIFKFRARNCKSNNQIKAEVYLGGTCRGFTPNQNGEWLIVETSQPGPFSWYAKYDGKKIDSGSSSGGQVEIIYSP